MRSRIAVCGALLALFGACASEPTPTVTEATIEIVEVTQPTRMWVVVGEPTIEPTEEARATAKNLVPANAATRTKAIASLGALGVDGARAAALHLDDASADVRYSALAAIIAVGPPAIVVSSSVVNRIQDKDAGVRHQALRALRVMKFDSSDTIIECLNDPVWTVRYEAAHALGTMQLSALAKDAVERASREDRDATVRRACRVALDR